MAQRYTRTAIGLHWLMALLIAVAFGAGWYMTDLKISPAKLQWYSWHKWLGITLLLLVALRLAWRAFHRPPAAATHTPGWQRLAATVAHGLLYVLMFAVPLSGWAFSSASGYSVVWLGVVPLPDWVPKDKSLAATLKDTHEVLTTALLAMVALHVAAALKHQFIDRDRLLARMGVGRRG